MKTESKVGMFVFIGLLFLFLMSTQVNKFSTMMQEGYEVEVVLQNSSGLDSSSKVKVNGLEAGFVKRLYPYNNRVKAVLSVHKGIEIPNNSLVIVTQESMLGIKFIDIRPGNSSVSLNDGDVIDNEKVYVSLEETSSSIYKSSEELRTFVKSLNEVFNENTKENLKSSIDNLEELTASINSIFDAKVRDDLQKTFDNFQKLSSNLSGTIEENRDALNDAITSIASSAKNFSVTGNKLGSMADEVKETTEHISGSVETLLTENSEPLNKVLKSMDGFFVSGTSGLKKIDSYLDSLTQSELEVAMRSEYILDDSLSRNYFSMIYRSSPTRFYNLDIVKGHNFEMGTNGIAIPYEKHVESDILVSAQFGKRYNDLVLRGGFIENSGGMGLDYYSYNDKLKYSMQIFDFDAVNDARGDNAHLKIGMRYTMLKHVDLFLGIDNILNSESSSVFVGAGVRFIDNDMKLMLGQLGAVAQ